MIPFVAPGSTMNLSAASEPVRSDIDGDAASQFGGSLTFRPYDEAQKSLDLSGTNITEASPLLSTLKTRSSNTSNDVFQRASFFSNNESSTGLAQNGSAITTPDKIKPSLSGKSAGTPSFLSPGVGIVSGLHSHSSRREKPSFGTRAQGALASLAYVSASCSMILANKMVLSSYNWRAPVTLMVYQNLISTVAVVLLRYSRIVVREPISWHLVRLWLPVNILFMAMLLSSLFALQNLQVAMVTILKNCTNVLTAVGETYLLNTQHGAKVWSSLVLMIISAILGGQTDLSFNLAGYVWQIINCFTTASYTLTLRHVMKSVRQHTLNGAPMGEFTMVLLNSAISLPFGAALALWLGEWEYALASENVRLLSFWAAVTMTGVLGLAISFSSMWCLHTTSPTTYSLIGSFNKVPLAVLGIILFNAPVSAANVSSIFLGLSAGILLAYAKISK